MKEEAHQCVQEILIQLSTYNYNLMMFYNQITNSSAPVISGQALWMSRQVVINLWNPIYVLDEYGKESSWRVERID
jgi:hypothetical protein